MRSIYDELTDLNEVLTNRYEDELAIPNRKYYLSSVILPYVDSDPEALLYCLYYDQLYEFKLEFDETKLFPARFAYPALVKYVSHEHTHSKMNEAVIYPSQKYLNNLKHLDAT